MGYLERWGVTFEELDEIITANPSLRGMVFGYVAERRIDTSWFDDERISDLTKHDDHLRAEKGDHAFAYRDHPCKVETKSLQTATVKNLEDGSLWGQYQCDGSDKRTLHFHDGTTLATTLLRVGDFDIVAVNLFEFFGEWRFAFAKNQDLERSTFGRYTDEQRENLIKSMQTITWPLRPPYRDEPWSLLDEIIEARERGVDMTPDAEVVDP